MRFPFKKLILTIYLLGFVLVGSIKDKGATAAKRKLDSNSGVKFIVETSVPFGPGTYLVIIRDIPGDTYIPIFIGPYEGGALNRALNRIRPPRPLTHELITTIINGLGGKLKSMVISELKNNTFIGTLFIQQGKKVIKIDCRPSDGLNIAIRMGAEIRVAQKVIKEAGLTEDEMIKKGFLIKKASQIPTTSF